MYFILSLLTTLALGLSMLQCEKQMSPTRNANVAKTTTVNSTTNENSTTNANLTITSNSNSSEAVHDEAPRISLEDAKKAFDDGSAVFIDTRPADSYKLEHVKGAINITSNDFEARYKEIPTGKKIIAYCS